MTTVQEKIEKIIKKKVQDIGPIEHSSNWGSGIITIKNVRVENYWGKNNRFELYFDVVYKPTSEYKRSYWQTAQVIGRRRNDNIRSRFEYSYDNPLDELYKVLNVKTITINKITVRK